MAGQDNGIQEGIVPFVPIEQITVHRESTDGILNPSLGIAPITFGSAIKPDLPSSLANLPGMADAAEACAIAYKSVASALQAAYEDCRTDCTKSTDDCARCIESSIQNAINFAAAVCHKTQDKVMSAVGRGMGDAVEFASAAGLQLGFPESTTPVIPTTITPIQDVTQPPPPTCNPPCPVGSFCAPTTPPSCVEFPHICPPGTHWDSTQQACVPDTHTCPAGQHWDATQNMCVPDTPPPPPPPGGCSTFQEPCLPNQGSCACPPELLAQMPQPAVACNVDANGNIETGNPPGCFYHVPGLGPSCTYTPPPPSGNPPETIGVPCPPPAGQTCGCPAQPEVSRDGPKRFNPPSFTSCSPDGLVTLGHTIDNFGDATAPNTVSDGFGASGVINANKVLGAFSEQNKDVVSTIVSKGISWVFGFLTGIADDYLNYIGGTTGCSTGATHTLAVRYQMAKFVDKFTGSVPEGDLETMRMSLNYACPWKIPSTGQLNNLLNGGWITTPQWETAIKFNGDCVEWQDLLQQADNARPTIGDAVTLSLRDQIDDDTYNEWLTKNSADPDEFGDKFKQLRQAWPTGDETLRIAARGMIDDDFAQKYDLDHGAEVNQNTDIKKWLKANGIEDSLFQTRWREHWNLPGLSTINEWLNRLRPNRCKVNDPLPGVDFTEDDAKQLLRYAGYPDSIHDKLLAMRHKPISFRHIAKSYIYGKMDDKDVVDAYKSMGYTDDVADALGNALIEDNTEKRAVYQGKVPEKMIRKAFDNSVINSDKATEFLLDLGVPFDIADQRVSDWDLERSANETIELTKLIKRRFLRGDYSTSEAHTQLARAGVDGERIDKLTAVWTQQRDANTKIPAVSQLCKWFSQRLIDANTYVTRLQNLGWTAEDAQRIATVCANDETMKELKAAIAAAEKYARQAKQAQKEKLKELKDAQPCKPPPKPVCGRPVPIRG